MGKIVNAENIADDSTWWNMVVDVGAARIMGQRLDGDLMSSAAPSSNGCNAEPARAELARRAALEADLTPDELRVSEEQARAAVPVALASWRAAQYELHLCELDAELATAT